LEKQRLIQEKKRIEAQQEKIKELMRKKIETDKKLALQREADAILEKETGKKKN